MDWAKVTDDVCSFIESRRELELLSRENVLRALTMKAQTPI